MHRAVVAGRRCREGTLVGAWVYNLVAAQVGGFEFTTVEIGGDV